MADSAESFGTTPAATEALPEEVSSLKIDSAPKQTTTTTTTATVDVAEKPVADAAVKSEDVAGEDTNAADNATAGKDAHASEHAADGKDAAIGKDAPADGEAATPPKKQWGDDDYGDDLDLSKFNSLQVSNEEAGDVDKPEISLKSDTLNEAVEAPETEIRKVLAEKNTIYTSVKSFEELNLSENLLRGLYSEMKFEKPSRIQSDTLPLILTPPYANLIAQAHNGSGKTTCFVLGMLSRVDPGLKAPQALCVCPTRELAIQNEEVLLKMGKYTGITSSCTATAETNNPVSSSRRGQIVDQVIIGTPGTLKRWMTRDKILSTRNIKVLVFDEADHMLDQDGFQVDSLRILNNIKLSKGNCQILLFSATFSTKVKAFAMRTIPSANYIFVEKEKLSLDVIKQYQVRCPDVYDKLTVLKDKIFPSAEKLGQSIVFVRTRQSARSLHEGLEADGFKCTSIQGGLSHEERDQVIKEFRSGETKILIATDVLARGFDQAQVTLVINYDLPTKNNSNDPDFELYLHRIGRSGRFGRKGAAFNLTASDRDERTVDAIARHFNREIPSVPWNDEDEFEKVLKEAGLA